MKKILAIDDQQDNLTTIKAVIKGYLADCEVLTALSGKDGIEIAQKEQPDTILLDIIMPQMDGYEVCKRLKENKLTKHIPVVMVTAIKTDSESRVKGLNIGADAFLAKPIDPVELTAQVNVMLRIKAAEDKLRGEKETLEDVVEEKTGKLEESETLRRTVFDSLDVAIHVVDSDLHIKLINRKFQTWCEQLGFETKYFGKYIQDILPFLNEAVISEYQQVFKNGESIITQEVTSFDGQEFATETRKIPLKSRNKVVGVITSVTDITEKKKAEEELRFRERTYKTLINNLPGFTYRCQNDKNWTMDFISAGCENITGYSPDDFINNKNLAFNDIIDPEYQTKVWADWQKVLNDNTTFEYEYTIITKSKEIRWIWERGCGIYSDDGELLYLEGFITDITERKLAEAALSLSEQKYKTLYDFAPIPYQSLNEDGTINDINPSWLSLLGYERDEVIGKMYEDFIHPEDKAVLLQNFPILLNEGRVHQVPFRIRHKAGHYFDIALDGCSVNNPDGNSKKTYCVFQDITERKLAEQLLKENEERYRDLIEKAGVAVAIDDLEGNFTYFNEKFANLFGYSSDEIKKKSIQLLVHPDDIEMVMQFHKASLQGERVQSRYEFRALRKDGSTIYLEVDAIILKEGESIVGTRSYIWDVTERKKAEEAIRESEERYRTIYQNTTVGIYRTTKEGSILAANPALINMLGFSSLNDLISRNLNDEGFKRSYTRKYFIERLEKDGKIIGLESTWYCKDGSVLFVNESATLIRDEMGKIIYYDGVVEDITERKKAELALKSSEERLKIIFESAPDAYYLNDFEGKFTGGNIAAEKLLGYSKEEFMGKNFVELGILRDDEIEQAIGVLAENIKGKSTGPHEYNLKRKDGTEVNAEILTHVVKIDDEDMVLGLARDITERKRAEEELKKRLNELEIFDDASVDREIMINELRKEINEMLKNNGKQEKYDIVT